MQYASFIISNSHLWSSYHEKGSCFLRAGYIHCLLCLLRVTPEHGGQNSSWAARQQNAYTPLTSSRYSVWRRQWWIELGVTLSTRAKFPRYDELATESSWGLSVMVISSCTTFSCSCCIAVQILAQSRHEVKQIWIPPAPWSLFSSFM